MVKERGSLSHDLQKRISSGSSSSSSNSKKGPGRPPLLASPTGTNTPVSSAPNLATSMASNLPFSSLAASGLSGLNSNLLSSLSLGQFDPKTNPLLLPFGGMPNMSALNSMGGLGSLGNMNLFANLAGLGIPGLTGMDASNLAETGSTGSGSGSGGSSKNKNRTSKPDGHSSSKVPVSSSSNTLPTTSPFPFFFPNPSLLYTPLGLGGLNPFTLQPGMSAAYDSLAQQCGLLNGTLGVSSAAPTSSRSSKVSSSASSRATTTVTSVSNVPSTSSTSNKQRSSSGSNQPLQQLLLPHDAHLLESIRSFDNKRKDSDKKDDKRKFLENLGKTVLPPEYSTDKHKGSKRDFDRTPDLSKFMEIPGSSKRRDLEMKEALEQLCKSSPEYIAQTLSGERSQKRPREKETTESKEEITEMLPPSKKIKESPSTPTITEVSAIETAVDIEALLTPSTVVKGPIAMETEEKSPKTPKTDEPTPEKVPVVAEKKTNIDSPPKEDKEKEKHRDKEPEKDKDKEPKEKDKEKESSVESSTESLSTAKKVSLGGRRTRGKRKSGEMDTEPPVIERKNLRSSAGRAAAAAAARAAAEQAAAKREEAEKAEDCKSSEDKSDS